MKATKLFLGITVLVALVAAGGCGRHDRLSAQLKSPNAMLRKQAVTAISQSLGQRVARRFALLMHNEAPAQRAVAEIAPLVGDESEDVRLAAVRGLGNIGYRSAIEPLMGALAAKDIEVRVAAVEALGRLQAARAVPAILAIVQESRKGKGDERLLLTGIWALGNIGDPAACGPLTRLLASDDSFVRYNAAHALKNLQQ